MIRAFFLALNRHIKRIYAVRRVTLLSHFLDDPIYLNGQAFSRSLRSLKDKAMTETDQ
jgi:hypothetical protein